MKKFNPYIYNISIQKDLKTKKFRAEISGFPDVVEYGETAEEAYEFAIDTLNILYRASKKEGWQFPESITTEERFERALKHFRKALKDLEEMNDGKRL
jgi:predicted RNase H-like HicB family nuclease